MTKRTTGRRVPGFDKPLPAPVVLGLDLSLRATCMAAVPVTWRFNWSKVATARSGESLRRDAEEHERVKRLQYIVDDVSSFAKAQGVTHVVIEQYALRPPTGPQAMGALAQAHAIGELGGAVKCELQCQLGLPLVVVSPASVRTLLGKLPMVSRKSSGYVPQKEWAAKRLIAAGAPRDWIGPSDDPWGTFDAFALANWLLAESGQAVVMREQTELAL